MSESVGAEIAAALVAFQAECKDVAPNAEADTGKFSYRYADLSRVLAEIKPKLKKHGLAAIQTPTDCDGCVGVRTLIVHKSGESIDAGTILLPMTQQTPQGAGACITYARRYALGALAGIATDHDDDAASQQPKGDTPPAQRGAPASGGSTGKAFDQPLGFGKHKDKTWREMTEGSIGGERHDYLIWLVGNIDPNKDKYAKNRVERAQKCLAIIGKRVDTEAAEAGVPGEDEPPYDDEPPLPDDGAEGF